MEFNTNQKEAIHTIDGNMVVIAAAGSGKTSVLTYRILNMVKNYGVDPTTILAVTFSKKAKESIEQRLGRVNRLMMVGFRNRLKIWMLFRILQKSILI